ncbi:MAG TPA: hypothetical protein VGS04_03005, partial [Nitrososphaerales archaeon]|nr:hypothetical protein [Nitrososphaerales archaeon]
VLQRRPGTRIIITSAHDEIAEEASRLGLSFIEKPFSMKKLVREVEAIRHRLLIVASPGIESLAIPTGL